MRPRTVLDLAGRIVLTVSLIGAMIALTTYNPLELTKLIFAWVNDYHPGGWPVDQVRELVYIWSCYGLNLVLTATLVWIVIWQPRIFSRR